MYCAPITATERQLAALDGGAYASMSRGSATTAAVQTLVANPYFVCWARGGSHQPAGILATLVLVLYVAGLPLCALLWMRRDAVLRAGNQCPKDVCACACRRRKPLLADVSPLKNAVTVPPPDPLLAPFLADYRPAAWYTKHADLGLTLTLSLLQALLAHPSILSLVIAKAFLIASYALCLATHAFVARPFLSEDTWKGWVRALVLVITAGCAVSNAAAAAVDLGSGGPVLAAAVAAMSFALLGLIIVTALILVISFSRAVWTSAGIEERQLTERNAAVCYAGVANPMHAVTAATSSPPASRRKLLADAAIVGTPADDESVFTSKSIGDVGLVHSQGDRMHWHDTARPSGLGRGSSVRALTAASGKAVSLMVERNLTEHHLTPINVRNPLLSSRRQRSVLRSPWASTLSSVVMAGSSDAAAVHAAARAARDALLAPECAALDAADASLLASYLDSLLAAHGERDAAISEVVLEALVAVRSKVGDECFTSALPTGVEEHIIRVVVAHGDSCPAVLSSASVLINCMCEASEARTATSIDSGAVKALITSMRTISATLTEEEVAAAEATFVALATLAAQEQGAAAVVHDGGMELIADVISRRDAHCSPGLFIAAVTLLANTAAHTSSAAAGRFLAAKGVPGLIALLQCACSSNDASPGIISSASSGAALAAAVAGAICSIATHPSCETVAAALSQAGAGPALAATLRTFPRDAAVVESACWSLSLLLQRQGGPCPTSNEEGSAGLASVGVCLEDAGVVLDVLTAWTTPLTSVVAVKVVHNTHAAARAEALLALLQH
jgi:hypothetical protein